MSSGTAPATSVTAATVGSTTSVTSSTTVTTATTATNGGSTGIDPNADPLEGMGPIESVATGFVFTEGPVWRADEGVLLFTDIPADTIYRLTPPMTVDTFRGPTMPTTAANGLGLDVDGTLLACEHGPARVTRTLANGQVEIVADRFGTDTFNSPNDNVTHSNGTIYFTDPDFGGVGTVGFNGVFRIDPNEAVFLVADDMTRPNGIGLSPDESILYVVDFDDALVRTFPVEADGTTGPGSTLIPTGGGGDGMTVDQNGNLYVTTSAGVLVTRPDGTAWGTIVFPEVAANCGFGGPDRRTLYATARSSVYSVRLAVPGLPPP